MPKKKIVKVDIVEKTVLRKEKDKPLEKEESVVLTKSGFDPDLPLKKQREFL